jgi:hypothetical protein
LYSATSALARSTSNTGQAWVASGVVYGLSSPNQPLAWAISPRYWVAASAFRSMPRTKASRMRWSSNGARWKLK